MSVDWVVVEWAPTNDAYSTTPTWVALTKWQSISIVRGRSSAAEAYRVGELVVDFENGHHTETATFNPETFYRWRQIRVRLDDGGMVNTAPLFHGWIQDVTHVVPGDPFANSVTVRAVDLIGAIDRVSAVNLYGDVLTDGYSTTLLGLVARVNSNMAGMGAFDTGDYDAVVNAPIFMPTSNVSSSMSGAIRSSLSAKPLDLIQAGMEVEGGTVQGAPDGKLAVNGRYSTLKALGSAAAFVISDTPGAGEFTALRPSIVIAQPGRDYFNAVEAMGWRTGLLDYTDPGSVPFYDVLSRADLATDDYGWVEANSVMWGRLYAQANTWPASVDLNLEPADDAVKAKAVADVSEILGRSWVQVELTPGGSTQRTWKAVVDGVEHMIDAERWTCRLLFSSGDRWATFTPYSEIGKVANSVTAIVGTHKVGP